eukprot:g33940.t1
MSAESILEDHITALLYLTLKESVLCEGAEILAVTGTIRGSPLGVGPGRSLLPLVDLGDHNVFGPGLAPTEFRHASKAHFRAKLLYSCRVFDVEAISGQNFCLRPSRHRRSRMAAGIPGVNVFLGDLTEGFDFKTPRTPTGSGILNSILPGMWLESQP